IKTLVTVEGVIRVDALEDPLHTAIRFSMPVWFVEKLMGQMGRKEAHALLEALNKQAPITLRTNTLQTTREALVDILREEHIPSEQCRYAPEALNLLRRINANAIPEFKEGWFE